MSTGDQDRQTTVGEIKQRSQGTQKDKKGGALASLSAQLGNDEMLERLAAGNENRDDLLDFIVQRLGQMRDAQLAEIELATVTENSMRTTLGDSTNQHEKPDPQRFDQAARLYQEAGRALCSGQLHRGKELMDQAVREDQRAHENLSKFVKQEEAASELDAPSVEITSEVACTDRTEPDGLGIADDILAVTTEGNQNIKGQRRELDPWWTDLEEEEEEEEGGT